MKYNVIDNYLCITYYYNSEIHREDGPAVIWHSGTKGWCKNGKYYREEGPAIEFYNGKKSWYLNGICYGIGNDFTNESWIKFINTLIFS